jgi:hypothetical protein
VTILLPQGFSDVVEWADQMTPLLEEQTANFPRLDNPEDWQRWARAVFLQATRTGEVPPDPYDYDDWRDWVMRLYSTTEFSG